MSCTTSEAEEVGTFFAAAVEARLGEGRARVIADIARRVDMKPSRVAKLMRREIPRLWADEYTRVCDWYDRWSAQRAGDLRARADELEARTQARRAQPL